MSRSLASLPSLAPSLTTKLVANSGSPWTGVVTVGDLKTALGDSTGLKRTRNGWSWKEDFHGYTTSSTNSTIAQLFWYSGDVTVVSSTTGTPISISDATALGSSAAGIFTYGASLESSATMRRLVGAAFACGYGDLYVEMRVKLETVPVAGSNDWDLWLGFVSATGGASLPPVNALGFAVDVSSGSNSWLTYASESSTSYSADTGVALSTSWKKLAFSLNAACTLAVFYIDGVEVGRTTDETRLPDTGELVELGIASMHGAVSGVNRKIHIDYFEAACEYTTPR